MSTLLTPRTCLGLFLGMTLFGSATPLSKLVAESFPTFSASFLRVALGALVLSPLAWRDRSGLTPLTRTQVLRLIALALFGVVGFTALLLQGMRLTSGVAGAVVMSTTPVVTALASVWFLNEAWTRAKVGSVGLAVAGVALLHLSGPHPAGDASLGAVLLGSLFVFGAVCCEAAYSLLGKSVMDSISPALAVFVACVLSLPVFLGLALLFEREQLELHAISVANGLTVAAWGAGTLGLGSVLWYSGLRQTEGSVAAGFMGVMPVSALVFSYLLLDEPVRWLHLAGFSLVLAGVIWMTREHRENSGS
mgnify:CR=1 FL=1